MSLVAKLIGFGFRQTLGADAGHAAEIVVGAVEKHFADHSQTLPKALAKANNRAWQALSIALAGDGFLDKIKVFFASGDDKGIREQVQLFLQDKNIGFEGTSADFRKQCLVELKTAKQAGLLTVPNPLAPKDVARQTASFQRYADPKGMMDGAEQVMAQIADELAADFPNLAKLLRQRPHGGPPLLVSAFAYFFRREVETNNELAHGLFFDGLRQLSAAQEKSFDEVNKALTSLGDQFEQVFQQLDRIETVVVETQTYAVRLLDGQAELQRLGNLHLANAGDLRSLMLEVLNHVSQAGMQKGEVKPHHSFSIRSEDERAAVKQLLARFRQLPDHQQKQVPALLNGLGKLQFGSGDFGGAKQTFVAVAEEVHDAPAQAEAHFNAYRAALEERKWDDALVAIQKAASLDSQRFAPFPMQRYQPIRILGAGGFGTAFLCHDQDRNAVVVVKTLHDATLEQNVFREAHVLKDLSHPAIIRIRAVAYCDKALKVRPYIVMDYFPGESLESRIQNDGTLKIEDLLLIARQIAHGMRFAHQKNIFHRDLKPDNVLVCKAGDSWKVKIIDFGLALRKQTIETSTAARSAGHTILGDSVAGTIKYAPPEQMGEMKGVKPGPYSDVYSFGKLCCYALFKTTEPIERHWNTVPESIRLDVREMLDKCRDGELQHRFPSFEPVLKVLDALDPMQAQRKKEGEASQKADLERKHREQEETEKKQQNQEEARQKAESERKRREEEDAERKRLALVRRQQEEDTRQQAELERKRREQEEKRQQNDQDQRRQEDIRQKRWNKPPKEWLGVGVISFLEDVRQKAWNRTPKLWLRVVGVGFISFLALFVCVIGFRNSLKENKSDLKAAIPQKPKAAIPQKPKAAVPQKPLDMKFVWIPPGTFLMGSPKEEKERRDNETQHKVTLSKGFYMGVHLVTQEQWQAVMDKNPSSFKGEENLPVETVSWNDCQDFIEKLRKKDKKAYRLPTEAEWEYACRAGTKTPFWFGETISTDQANYNGDNAYGNGKKGVYRQKTTPVGAFPANAYGLHDMHGNVWQWCQDWFGDYPQNDVIDPQGADTGKYRMLRGGSWDYNPQNCRSAYRNGYEPGLRLNYCGLRVCFCLE